MKAGYLDCFSGISGDMLLGALIDAGVPEAELKNSIKRLNLSDCEIDVSRVTKNTLAATRVTVKVADEQPNRHLTDIERCITSSDLEVATQEKVLEVFHSLAEAEADVHPRPVDSAFVAALDGFGRWGSLAGDRRQRHD